MKGRNLNGINMYTTFSFGSQTYMSILIREYKLPEKKIHNIHSSVITAKQVSITLTVMYLLCSDSPPV